jgi:hypothetical protein
LPEKERRLFKQAIEHYMADDQEDFGCNLEDIEEKFPDIHRYLIEKFVSSGAKPGAR